MAKNTRSGLGRGLNSLLGGLSDETSTERIKVKQEPKDTVTAKAKLTPAAAPLTQERVTSSAAQETEPLKEQSISPDEVSGEEVLAEDKVTIKSVSIREPKTQQTSQ